METSPSNSTWSEAFILSDDSGLLLTNCSISSGSMSAESTHNRLRTEDSDKSLSQDSLDGMSDIMCSENFNTLKKNVNWITGEPPTPTAKASPIEPPLEFQDPKNSIVELFSVELANEIIDHAVHESHHHRPTRLRPIPTAISKSYWNPDFITFSPCHTNARPNSRNSLGSSRLSSSHNSLSVPTAHRVDDSSFIMQAVSHDTLSATQISDLYNVPFDSDVYAVPVDVVKPYSKNRRIQNKKRRRNTSSGCREIEIQRHRLGKKEARAEKWCLPHETKRHSVAGTSAPIENGTEPIHMTLQEVRNYLQNLYSSSSDSDNTKDTYRTKPIIVNNKYSANRSKKTTFLINMKNKKVKDTCCDNYDKQIENKPKKHQQRFLSFKQALCNMFKFRRFLSPEHKCDKIIEKKVEISEEHNNISSRALPPIPSKTDDEEEEQTVDFATSLQRVKDYGWYWGPLSSEAAEKILSNEPDGSFIVRDSSDDHYIFSLTFKLNNCVRHVRIDHGQGNFSFGSCTKFKSQTIVEFIENAVEHSRSGRYLFFLHRRPLIGPVRVQLLHPVSRFKQVQSLQHICRFAIHKVVRRDLIPSLPLPRRMIDYLNTPHYYSEHLIDVFDNTMNDQHAFTATVPDVPVNNYVLLNDDRDDRRQ